MKSKPVEQDRHTEREKSAAKGKASRAIDGGPKEKGEKVQVPPDKAMKSEAQKQEPELSLLEKIKLE